MPERGDVPGTDDSDWHASDDDLIPWAWCWSHPSRTQRTNVDSVVNPRSKSKRGKGRKARGAAAKAAAAAPVAQAEGHVIAEQLDREENVDLTLAHSLQLQLQLEPSSGDELLQQFATVPQTIGAAEERPSYTPRRSPQARVAQLRPHLLPPLPLLDMPQLLPPPEQQPEREAEVRTASVKRKWVPSLQLALHQLGGIGEAASGSSQQSCAGTAAA